MDFTRYAAIKLFPSFLDHLPILIPTSSTPGPPLDFFFQLLYSLSPSPSLRLRVNRGESLPAFYLLMLLWIDQGAETHRSETRAQESSLLKALSLSFLVDARQNAELFSVLQAPKSLRQDSRNPFLGIFSSRDSFPQLRLDLFRVP